MENKQNKYGKVILAAAGPGDPDLITVKAVRYLGQADVVLTDRLVSDDILKTYVNREAEIIYVGKQCRRGKSTPQLSINELMIQFALEGKLVVRLKGGDVSIFSNILDELEALVKNNIEYEVIPGVTAALGAAAYAGIPLTARGYSTGVRFLTLYKSDIITAEYWKELATTDDTLVFYMSAETLNEVAGQLVQHKIAEDKLLAIVEQATTPLQDVKIMNLYEFAGHEKPIEYISPTLAIIGRVVSLHQQFAWKKNNKTGEYFFNTATEPLKRKTRKNPVLSVSVY